MINGRKDKKRASRHGLGKKFLSIAFLQMITMTLITSSAHAGWMGTLSTGASILGSWLGTGGSDDWMQAYGCGQLGTLGFVICNFVISFESMPQFLSALSYLFAIVLGFLAILKLKDHVLDPRSVPLWEPAKRAFASGLFFSMPYIAAVLTNSLVMGSIGQNAQNINGGCVGNGGTSVCSDADKVGGVYTILGFMNNLAFPMSALVSSFAWIAGIIFIMVGISRMLKSTQEGARGPGGIGTMMTFFVGAVLMSLNSMIAVMSESLFTGEGYRTYAVLQGDAGLDEVQQLHVEAMISSVVIFCVIVGWVSFTRGWFILREHAEGGGQASLMSAFTHIIAGALAINIGPLINVVQLSLGLEAYGVGFTPG